MFEKWPRVLRKLGTPRKLNWWEEVSRSGHDVVEKREMEET